MIEIIKSFFQKEFVKRIITLVILIWVLYLMRSMLNLFLLTFIFTYLIYSFQGYIVSKIKILSRVKKSFITMTLFFISFIFIGSVLYKYIPIGIKQVTTILLQIEGNIDSGLLDRFKTMIPAVSDFNIKDISNNGINYVLDWFLEVGKLGLNIIMAFILSLFFLVEIDKIKEFFRKFEESRVAPVFTILKYFGRNFLNSFGKVVQAQILIAITNTGLSAVVLAFIGFNQLLGLAIMIFILSLIPVAGTIISLIPLSIMAYNMGGVNYIIYIIVLITVLHTLEAYVLNPKFMSSKTELPVFVTFLVLVISEHFFGVWGLLLGIPSFIFFLDLMNIKAVVVKKNKHKMEG